MSGPGVGGRGWRWRWMFFDERPQKPPLPAREWLDIAVDGLVPAAAERVRAEHLAHLEDALESGESEIEVVRGWGDPHRAARTLRRAHPTVSEQNSLPPVYSPGPDGLRAALRHDRGEFVAAFLITGGVWYLSGQNWQFWWGLYLSVWTTTLVVLRLLRWRLLAPHRSLAARMWGEWMASTPTVLLLLLFSLPLLRPLEGPRDIAIWAGVTGMYSLAHGVDLRRRLQTVRKLEGTA